MSLLEKLRQYWLQTPFRFEPIEEAEFENVLHDHDAAMSRIESSTNGISASQDRLRNSIKNSRAHETRDTIRAMLERTRWPT